MKSILKKILIFTAALCLTGINNIMPVAADAGELTAVYFGGSATCGEDEYDTWMEQVSERLAAENNVKVNSLFEGVANMGSEVGQYRAADKICSAEPDIVFIDFAADDTDIETTEYVENIILTVGKLAKLPQIVFVNSAKFDSSSAGMLVSNGVEIEKLAANYGLDTIDMLLSMEMCDDIPSLFGSDGITLSQEGHNLFAEDISRAVIYGDCLKTPDMTAEKYNADAKAVNTNVNTLTNSSYGAKTIKFRGKSFIAAHTKDSSGTYKIVIDGNYSKDVKISSSQSCIGWSMTNLADSYHTAVITPTEGSNVNVFEYYTDYGSEQYSFINESFESGTTKAKAVNNATAAIVSEGARFGGKALRVTSSATSGTALMFPANFYEGTYKLSCYVKTVGFVPKENFSTFTLVVYQSAVGGGTGWSMHTVSDVKYVQDDWVYVEAQITSNGKCYYNSAWVDSVAENSQVQLRIGDKNGNLKNTNDGNAITYEIDNFILEPIVGENTEKMTVKAEADGNTVVCSASAAASDIREYSYKLMRSEDGFNWYLADVAAGNDGKVSFNVTDKALYKVAVTAFDSADNVCASGESDFVRLSDFLFGDKYKYNISVSADFDKLSAKYDICGIDGGEVYVIYAQYNNDDRLLCSCKRQKMTASNKTVGFTDAIDPTAETVKVMIFDGPDSIKPMAECKAKIKGN